MAASQPRLLSDSDLVSNRRIIRQPERHAKLPCHRISKVQFTSDLSGSFCFVVVLGTTSKSKLKSEVPFRFYKETFSRRLEEFHLACLRQN